MAEIPKQNTAPLDTVTNETVADLSTLPNAAEQFILEEDLSAQEAVAHLTEQVGELVGATKKEIQRLAQENSIDASDAQKYLDKLEAAQTQALEALKANQEKYEQIEKFVEFRSGIAVWNEAVSGNMFLADSPESLESVQLNTLIQLKNNISGFQKHISNGEALPVPEDLAAEKNALIASARKSIQELRDAVIDPVRSQFAQKLSDAEAKRAEVSAMVAPDVAPDIDTIPEGENPVYTKPSFKDLRELEAHADYLENFVRLAEGLSNDDPLKVNSRSILDGTKATMEAAVQAFSAENPPLEKALNAYYRYWDNLKRASYHRDRVKNNPKATTEEKNGARGWLAGAQQNFERATAELRSLLSEEDRAAFRTGVHVPLMDPSELPPATPEDTSDIVDGGEGQAEAPSEPVVQPSDETEEKTHEEKTGPQKEETPDSQEEKPVEEEESNPIARKEERKPKNPLPDAVIPRYRTQGTETVSDEELLTAMSASEKNGEQKKTPASSVEVSKEASSQKPGIPEDVLRVALREVRNFQDWDVADKGPRPAPSVGDDELRAISSDINKYGLSPENITALRDVGFTVRGKVQPGEKIFIDYKDPGTGIKKTGSLVLPGEKLPELNGEKLAHADDDFDPMNPKL